MRRLCTIAAVLLAAGQCAAGEAIPSGLYAITSRLELPHLERYAVERTRTACLGEGSALPVPLLSAAAGATAGCAARDVVRAHGRLGYAIACPGRDALRAAADYRLLPQGFRGRVAMVLGAKNMSMTEVQAGRLIGACPRGSAGLGQ